MLYHLSNEIKHSYYNFKYLVYRNSLINFFVFNHVIVQNGGLFLLIDTHQSTFMK